MTDYPALYKRLARDIIARGEVIEGDTLRLATQLQKELKAQGYKVDYQDIPALKTYFDEANAAIEAGLTSAFALATDNLPGVPRSLTAAQLATRAFDASWPDGLTLSDRLWRWEQDTRSGLTAVLRAGVKMGTSVDAVVMDLQRTIETTTGGNRFKIVMNHSSDWVEELYESAVGVIQTPEMRQDWLQAVNEAEQHIETLSVNGSRRAAERALDQIKKGVAKGKEELIDKAVKWWTYDKQKAALKRIVRTEMANAFHTAVIDGTQADESIIGYQWRLSASHPVTDICDYYAGIELGLGKGVWPKEMVPKHKPHPHCMCLLLPRVSIIGQRGTKSYDEFIQKLGDAKQTDLLPGWAKQAVKNGAAMEQLIRNDGLGLITAKQAAEKGLIKTQDET